MGFRAYWMLWTARLLGRSGKPRNLGLFSTWSRIGELPHSFPLFAVLISHPVALLRACFATFRRLILHTPSFSSSLSRLISAVTTCICTGARQHTWRDVFF